MGLMLAEPGFHTRCFVEWEEYPRQAIIAAQRAGYFAPAPIWDDVTTFDGRPFCGAFDTILAGYPCQPFSQAGQRRGADDERHLWPEVARIIREVEPEWVFLENVAGHVSLGAETVLRELWDMGWTPAAGLFSASEIGAPHERLRWFCVAHRECGAAERQRPELAEAARDLQGEAREQRIWSDARDGGDSMAHADVVHAERSERWPDVAKGHVSDRDHPGRDQAPSGVGEPDATVGHPPRHVGGIHARPGPEGSGTSDAGGRGGDVGHPTRLGRGEGRAEHGVRVGRDTAASAGGAMADASGAERQGQQPGQRDTRGWQEPHGHPALSGGAGLFPPGPGDAAAWAAVLRSAPDMAPAAAARDLHAWARNMEADGREWWQAAAEPEFRRLVDGLADRSSKLRLLGNGVVPLSAAYAWRSLSAAHGLGRVDMEAAEGDADTSADRNVGNMTR